MRSSSASSAVLAVLVMVACSDNTSTLGALGATGGGAAGSGAGLGGSTSAGSGGSAQLGGAAGRSAGGVGGSGGSTPSVGKAGAPSGAGAGGTSAGTGGSVSTGGKGGTSSGTGGSPSPSCQPLVLEEAPRGIDFQLFDTRRELSPVIVPGDDGASATLAFHWTSYPGQTIYGVRYLPFAAFGAWPMGDFGPTFGGEPYDLQPPIVAAPGFGNTVAVLAHDPGFSAETGAATFLPAVTAPFASATGVVLASLDVSTPAFVARGKAAHLVGYGAFQGDVGGVPKGRLEGGLVTNGVYTPLPELAEQSCANSAIVADAIPFGDGFLVAQSTSLLCCSCDDQAYGAPASVVVRQIGGTDRVHFFGLGAVLFVKLLARPDGAWIVIGRPGAAGEGIVVQRGRLGLDGTSILEPLVTAPEQPLDASPVAIGALGDDVVIAQVRGTGKGATLTVYTYAPGGLHVGGATPYLSTKHAPRLPALLGSPDGTQLVVAWSLPSETEADADRIQMARFARTCDPSP